MRLRDLVRRVRVDEADDDVDQAALAGLDRLVGCAACSRTSAGSCDSARRTASRPSSMRLAMRISPSRVSSSTVPISRMYMRTGSVVRPNSASTRRERGGGFLGGFFVGRRRSSRSEQRLGVRCLLVHRDAHVVDHVDDVFDLLRIDDLGRQVIVDLDVGQVALLLAARDQQLQLRLALFGRAGRQTDLELLGAGLCRLAGLATRGDRIAACGSTAAGAAATLSGTARLGPGGWLGRDASRGVAGLRAQRSCRTAAGQPGGCSQQACVARGAFATRGSARTFRACAGLDRRPCVPRLRTRVGGGLACGCFPDLLACRLAQDGAPRGGVVKKSGSIPLDRSAARDYFAGCADFRAWRAEAPEVPAFRRPKAPYRAPGPGARPAVGRGSSAIRRCERRAQLGGRGRRRPVTRHSVRASLDSERVLGAVPPALEQHRRVGCRVLAQLGQQLAASKGTPGRSTADSAPGRPALAGRRRGDAPAGYGLADQVAAPGKTRADGRSPRRRACGCGPMRRQRRVPAQRLPSELRSAGRLGMRDDLTPAASISSSR